jgi:hypothetical protein
MTQPPRYTTPTPTQKRERYAGLCCQCHKRIRRPGFSTCSAECAEKRRQINYEYRERAALKKGYTIKRYKPKTPDQLNVQRAARKQRLTEDEKLERRRAATRKSNAAQRQKYLQVDLVCAGCGRSLLLCDCPPEDARTYSRVDVVEVLDVRTMRIGIARL